MSASNPDVIIFLGDLFNDASIANDQQFSSMVKEFHDIFPQPSTTQVVIWNLVKMIHSIILTKALNT